MDFLKRAWKLFKDSANYATSGIVAEDLILIAVLACALITALLVGDTMGYHRGYRAGHYDGYNAGMAER